MDKLLAIHPPSSLFSFRSFSLRKTLRRWPNMVPQWIFVLASRFGPQSVQKMRRFQLFCYSRTHSSKIWKKLIRIERNLNKIQIGIPFHVLQIKNQLNHLIVIESSWTLFFVWASTCNQFTNYISIIHYERGLNSNLNIYVFRPQQTKKCLLKHMFTYFIYRNLSLTPSHSTKRVDENAKLSRICTGRIQWEDFFYYPKDLRITGPSNGRVNEPVWQGPQDSCFWGVRILRVIKHQLQYVKHLLLSTLDSGGSFYYTYHHPKKNVMLFFVRWMFCSTRDPKIHVKVVASCHTTTQHLDTLGCCVIPRSSLSQGPIKE